MGKRSPKLQDFPGALERLEHLSLRLPPLEFHLFPLLPLEIQIEIWSYVMPPPLLIDASTISADTSTNLPKSAQDLSPSVRNFQSLIHLQHLEVRAALGTSLAMIRPSLVKEPKEKAATGVIWIRPAWDVLYFPDIRPGSGPDIKHFLASPTNQKLKSIALSAFDFEAMLVGKNAPAEQLLKYLPKLDIAYAVEDTPSRFGLVAACVEDIDLLDVRSGYADPGDASVMFGPYRSGPWMCGWPSKINREFDQWAKKAEMEHLQLWCKELHRSSDQTRYRSCRCCEGVGGRCGVTPRM